MDWQDDPPEPSAALFENLEEQFHTLLAKANVPNALGRCMAYTHRYLSKKTDDYGELDPHSHFDYFGCDELMLYIPSPYEGRIWGFVCVYGDLQIAKAYFHMCLDDASSKRARHAQAFLGGLAQEIEEGSDGELHIAQSASAGGTAKARTYQPLKDKFAELLASKRPAEGWKSKAQAARCLLEDIQAVNESIKPRPAMSEALERTMKNWLSRDPRLSAVYGATCKPPGATS